MELAGALLGSYMLHVASHLSAVGRWEQKDENGGITDQAALGDAECGVGSCAGPCDALSKALKRPITGRVSRGCASTLLRFFGN